jgi:hypothetical protein
VRIGLKRFVVKTIDGKESIVEAERFAIDEIGWVRFEASDSTACHFNGAHVVSIQTLRAIT